MEESERASCAALVKSLHRKLRETSSRDGGGVAWGHHVSNSEALQQYAIAMHRLAQLWEDAAPPAVNRLHWLRDQLNEYFSKGGCDRQFRRELLTAQYLQIQLPERIPLNSSPRILDVGSCYNPLGCCSEFQVQAIDLHPATSDVLQCDFLNAKLGDDLIINNNAVEQLVRNSYDAIVFSLLLEYLPMPEQRLQCCSTAYQLLKSEGVLAIVSPDSKHVGANAKIYKNWRYVLSKMGFSRIVYEKSTYLHCMMFRKSLHREIPERWAATHKESYMNDLMNIPQDFQDMEDHHESGDIRNPDESISVCEMFYELPDSDCQF